MTIHPHPLILQSVPCLNKGIGILVAPAQYFSDELPEGRVYFILANIHAPFKVVKEHKADRVIISVQIAAFVLQSFFFLQLSCYPCL